MINFVEKCLNVLYSCLYLKWGGGGSRWPDPAVLLMVKALEDTFNMEKALVGVFSGQAL